MTEIQFLCDLLLNHKCPLKIKERIIARIGEVESQLAQRAQPRSIAPSTQAASTQRALEIQESIAPQVTQAQVDKQTGTIIVPTGNGTRGPRKW